MTNRVKGAYQRVLTVFLSRQFLSFVFVGGSATLLQFVLLAGFVEWLMVGEVAASAAGYLLSSVYNYLLNYYFTFTGRQSHWQALPRFTVVVVIGVIVNTLVFTLMLYVMPYLLAQLFAVGATLVVNFLLHKFWIYRRT